VNYVALASDYDGTLAHAGIVSTRVTEALERLRHSGRKLILVTGRELPELQQVFPRLDLFECAAVENGAVLYHPQTGQKRVLTQPPPKEFMEKLRARGVRDLSCGDVIVATGRPFAQAALEVIQDLGLELQLIFNKNAVMILPSATNKMTGLSAALAEMRISWHNVVGVGDAENDDVFLSCCGFSVAVANAIPALKDKADWVTEGACGNGVIELIEALLKDDFARLDSLAGRSAYRRRESRGS
jgi:HAD superfamily hydrolase (TIGR01484 family)